MSQHIGKQSIKFPHPAVILSSAAIGGKKEQEGPLSRWFDKTSADTTFRMESWEQAERKMQQNALQAALNKKQLQPKDLQMIFAGDLLNQCISSNYALSGLGVPVFGLYGACSTMSEGLCLGAMAVSGGFAKRAAVMTSSHYAASERQYRFPLRYGGQRTPTAQWTVTGSGCAILGESGDGPRICHATVGSIIDMGITDANNMGAAMAPAAYETLRTHFDDFSLSPDDYDLIVTGDLGAVGRSIVIDLFRRDGVDITNVYNDCGTMIYDRSIQDVHAGGSGCGCSAVVLCGYLLSLMQEKRIRRLLFCGTGALLSPTATQQGASIPGVCHAVSILSQEVL